MTATKIASNIDLRLVKALSHPVRGEALRLLNQREMSATMISKELGVPLGDASYHVRELDRFGCIEMVRTESGDGRRGATERYYRAIKRPFFSDADWAHVPDSAKATIVWRDYIATGNMVSDSLAAGKFEARSDRHHSYFACRVDQKGWSDAMRLLCRTMEGLREIEVDSDERLLESGEEPIPFAAALLGFEMAE